MQPLRRHATEQQPLVTNQFEKQSLQKNWTQNCWFSHKERKPNLQSIRDSLNTLRIKFLLLRPFKNKSHLKNTRTTTSHRNSRSCQQTLVVQTTEASPQRNGFATYPEKNKPSFAQAASGSASSLMSN